MKGVKGEGVFLDYFILEMIKQFKFKTPLHPSPLHFFLYKYIKKREDKGR